jgi:hypothetical protein
MCGGQKKAHHAAEEAKRQAGIEADRARRAMEEADRRNREMIEAMKPPPQTYTPPPVPTAATLGTRSVKPKKSRKTSSLGSRRGISQLRIPLNVGQSATGGTNLPT